MGHSVAAANGGSAAECPRFFTVRGCMQALAPRRTRPTGTDAHWAGDDAFTLVALQAPVAADVHTVVGAIQNTADTERMGGLAVHVSKMFDARHPGRTLPHDVGSYFAQIRCIATYLGTNAQAVVMTTSRFGGIPCPRLLCDLVFGPWCTAPGEPSRSAGTS